MKSQDKTLGDFVGQRAIVVWAACRLLSQCLPDAPKMTGGFGEFKDWGKDEGSE